MTTNALSRMIAALTCKTCLGEGWLGGRRALFTRTLGVISYVDEGRKCPDCQGNGIAKEPGK